MEIKYIKTKPLLGLIPLTLVILPKESFNLYISKAPHKALINDCFATGNDFIIPFIYKGKIISFGARVKLVDIEHFYADGKMYIKVEGVNIVHISNPKMIKTIPYPIGESDILNSHLFSMHTRSLVDQCIKYLHLKHISIPKADLFNSIYDIARFIQASQELKIKLLINAKNPIVQSKIILTELNLQILTTELQRASGCRYYMN